ncbi:RHS repeat-associated core domain-containing protein [uncultured Winogradskyella sp.]|uniref:RHS repeat domain-containing protein n=1 Tax=uncultured Winogradskyella sp. TaxID=395353 RepID=UPI00260F8512|nr:RHS repeat-associated core domain-containing protein [uncultured Winogradskyella sp.]
MSTGITIDYAGNFIYENGTLKMLSHPEGYIEPGNKQFNYTYQFKDHLGNVRLTYADSDGNGTINSSTEIIEENNYYPFGLKHKGYNNNVSANVNSVARKFMFGGKEFNDELGLDWYDISARNYDPALGRWMNLDPLAEKMSRHSPYNFGFDNPVYFQDYDGMEPSGANCDDCPDDPKIATEIIEVDLGMVSSSTTSQKPQDFNPLPTPFGGLEPFMPSQETLDLFDQGKKLLSNVFKGELKKEVSHGVTLGGRIGPVNVEAEANLFVGDVSINEENKVTASGKIGELKGKLTIGNEENPWAGVRGGFNLAEFEGSVDLDNLEVDGTASAGDSYSEYLSGNSFLKADESFTLGASGKALGIKAKGSINFYNLGAGAFKMLQGVGSWLSDQLEHKMN